MKKTYVIIGSSAAGISAITAIAKTDTEAQIICISKDSNLPYNTCILAQYLAETKKIEDLSLLTDTLKDNPKVQFLFGKTVTKILTDKKKCLLNDQVIVYDALLLATGSVHNINKNINIPDNTSGIFYFHTLSDIKFIKEYISSQNVKDCVVVGAGLTGLECADALVKLGLNVTLVESQSCLLPRFLDYASSKWLKSKVNTIKIYTQKVVDFLAYDNKIQGVILESGKKVDTQLVILALGVRPSIELAKEAGLEVQNGIITDQYLQTTKSGVFAAGDCALVNNIITNQKILSSSWADAINQGFTAGLNMTGNSKIYNGLVPYISSRFFGINYIACGEINYKLKYQTKQNDSNYSIFFCDDNNILVGFLIFSVNNINSNSLKKAVMFKEKIDINNY